MRFLDFIKEAKETKTKKPSPSAKGQSSSAKKQQPDDPHVAITFGRFNPPHAGHGKLLDAVRS